MEKNLEKAVEEILQSNELREKKLSRKVGLIILGMILLLVTIIVVEFKEYSHNYTEYKIGTNELGPKDLVWAGIMGTPPRYYESNEKYGLGYREFDTREIRKALEEAGINLVYRYMSPNRLEFEFERKHPICFYDRKWSNPKEYFKKKRHPILSIPLYYSGKEEKKIFFRKGEKSRFEKHLDSKGFVNLDSLIKDTTLKTELIRKVEYDGPYANITYGKRQLDGTYYDYVKEKYRKNIDLVILHTNDQIIQMLKWKRFDYQFFDTIEYDDYPWMDGGQKGIDTLAYDVKTVNDVDDPNLVLHSVACGNHSLTKIAMPIINEVIKKVRHNKLDHDRASFYEKKLNPLTLRSNFINSLIDDNQLGKSVIKIDNWYYYQFKKINITPLPMYNLREKTPNLKLEIKKNIESLLSTTLSSQEIPHWNLIENVNKTGEKSLLIINDVDIQDRAEEKILQEKFSDYSIDHKKGKIIDKKINFKDLKFFKDDSIFKIIIFAGGIKNEEFKQLKPIFQSSKLKSITLNEAAPSHSKEFLSFLPSHLEELRLYIVNLRDLSFSEYIKKWNSLKVLDLQSTTLNDDELKSTLLNLSNTVETLNFIRAQNRFENSFPMIAAEIFPLRKFTNIKNFSLLNYLLDDRTAQLILNSLPLQLESLSIGGLSGVYGGISSLVLEDFLKARMNVNKLKKLHLHKFTLSLLPLNTIPLPVSLNDLLLNKVQGLNDSNFSRIIIPSKLKLKSLTITNCELNDYSIIKFLLQLDTNIKELNLENNKLQGVVFFKLMKDNAREIESLSLRSNPINDLGIFYLSKLPWKIKKINISNLRITDKALNFINSNNLWDLTSLNLGDNHLSAKSITKILEKNNKNLLSLSIDNVLSLNIKEISKFIQPKLEYLSLAGNMIDDKDVHSLVSVLPKELYYLDLTGSRMSAKSAYLLAKSMPKLSQFLYDFKFGEEEESLKYIYHTLSPYLTSLSNISGALSYENAKILSKSMPPYLKSIDIPEFESEECKILLASIPNSVKALTLRSNIKSKGQSLIELTKHFPNQLLSIGIGNHISQKERDLFITQLPYKYLSIWGTEYISSISNPLIKSSTNSAISTILGPHQIESYKNIIFSDILNLRASREKDIEKGLLYSFQKWQLVNLRVFEIYNCKNFDENEIFDFLKKLPPQLLVLKMGNLNIKLEDIDTFIRLLPPNLSELLITENSFGEEGLKKFREYKRKMEEKTGLPFFLEE